MQQNHPDRLPELSRTIHQTISAELPKLVQLAQSLWDNPEMTGQEIRSSRDIQQFLTERGFSVTPGKSGLQNAFIAQYGNGDFVVDISVEMDALPIAYDGRPINHACGHNVMAAMSIATGLALKEIADKAGITIRLQGDPGEEGLGQKIIKLEAGDYDGSHIYMGPHSAGMDRTELPSLANAPMEVRMVGRTSHDASGRQFGRPVQKGMFHFLDTLDEIEAYSAPGTIINHQGAPYFPGSGQANLVGEAGVARIMARHSDTSVLTDDILPRIEAAATGQGIAHHVGVVARALGPVYAASNTDPELSTLFVEAAAAEGRQVLPTTEDVLPSSTDFWNIPVPKVHPLVNIRDLSVTDETVLPLHSAKMAEVANPKTNPRGVADAISYAGAAFAMVAAKIATNPELRARFTAHALSVDEIRNGPEGRPGYLSAYPDWNTSRVLHQATGINEKLFASARQPSAPEFAIPMPTM